MISLPWKEVKSASLPVWPWHTSSPPLKLRNGSEETSGSDFKYYTHHYLSNQHHHDARYPVKPRSSIVSPKMDRNSLNPSLSSLLLSMSSSVSYREINVVREGIFQLNNTTASWFLTCLSFWHKMPNLKLRDTLCSSNAVISSGAWGMSDKEMWKDMSGNKWPSFQIDC